ncbi:hypothetical protein LOTGIDRAFT_124615 [Lottia gigantea]|uniref:sphingolipid 4-desaturase n=1 Tax=Lottia gigantea TaxID=225164 RepID=V3ZF74_LOTGI|nr:hypothetical protein LOTGIDRAFT_124615 [Lottia gigantea]ESO89808.1 hypothetical protein LOTGIDRAFT_124615 [Lottia gigantea]
MRWFDKFHCLSTKVASNEDEWMWSQEAHTERRQNILKKYPEIKKLMGYDSWIAYIVTVEVLIQIFMCWAIQDASWGAIVVMAYCFGAVLNHSLGSAIHEIGHNLAFGHGRPVANRLLSLWCNLPVAVPLAISYRKYHADHHRFLGEENKDVDIPTRLESFMFRHPITKILWLLFHPFIHAIRPFYKSPKTVGAWEIVNCVVQISFDLIIIWLFGYKSLIYLICGTLFGFGLHPLAGHFISEHYLFTDSLGTHSYYGPLNFILFNVGYHIEHHDFPYIPYHRLPKVKEIASEFYEDIPYHTSWVKVVWSFIFDKNLGPHARAVGYKKEKQY